MSDLIHYRAFSGVSMVFWAKKLKCCLQGGSPLWQMVTYQKQRGLYWICSLLEGVELRPCQSLVVTWGEKNISALMLKLYPWNEQQYLWVLKKQNATFDLKPWSNPQNESFGYRETRWSRRVGAVHWERSCWNSAWLLKWFGSAHLP